MKTLLSLVVLLPLVLAGCGSGAGPDPKVESARVNAAQQTRAMFDKSGGNFDSLSPDDKAATLKMFDGKEADARRSWDMMRSRGVPPTGGGSASRRPAAGTP